MTALAPAVESAAESLLRLDAEIVARGSRVAADPLYRSDFFVIGVLNRSLQLLHGFVLLVKNRQFICAAPLLRMQVDSALRLYAGSLVGNFDEFTDKLLEGKRIDRMTAVDGSRLTDRYLIQRLASASGEQWLEPVYESTSGYVHFSGAHLSRAVRAAEPGHLHLQVSRHEGDASENTWLELVGAFGAATRLVLRLVDTWVAQKEQELPTNDEAAQSASRSVCDTKVDQWP